MSALPHIQNILDRLHGVAPAGERKWSAHCPAHDDQRSSLSVGIGADDRALLWCHAGCHLLTICRAIDIRVPDLFSASHPYHERAAGRRPGKVVATYDYCDAAGTLLMQVVRYDPKDFRQRRPDGNGGWLWNTDAVAKPLFRLPELLAANPADWVYIPEGERDVLTLVAAGLVATCNPGGAGKWSKLASDSAAALDGRRVCIIADADGPGRAHALDVATRLLGRIASLRVIEMPGAKDPAAWFSSGGTVDRLVQIRDAAPEFTPPTERQRARIIQTNAHLRDLADQCCAALRDANDPPTLFLRYGELVRIVTDENSTPRIDAIDRSRLRARLTDIADFFVLRRSGDEWVESIAEPRLPLVETVLARGTWELPPLVGVTRAPILRHDGSLCTSPGYDADTRLYYCPPPGFALADVPAAPSIHDVDGAIAQLDELIADFPFSDQASRANALGLLFTLIMRPAIDGQVPLCVVDAPVQGTGKSLLVSVLASIVLGEVRGESIPDQTRDADEWRKKITSILLRGDQFVMLDNLPDGTAIDAPALAAVLTSREWSDRRLGSNESLTLPARAVWCATGNNLRIEGDMTRRCYLIRIDSNVERPWQREDFAIPDLQRHLRVHRPELLAAAFTVVRGWYADGCPPVAVPRLGGFEAWASAVGGVLHHAGVEGFLGNLAEITESRDDQGQQWARFFDAWWYEFGSESVSTDDVFNRIVLSQNGVHDPVIPDAILSAKDRGPGSARRTLGKALGRQTGRVYGDRKLVCTSDPHRKIRLWGLRPMDGSTSDGATKRDGALWR